MKTLSVLILVTGIAAAPGCAPSSTNSAQEGFGADATPASDALAPDARSRPDAARPAEDAAVYAHSSRTLYRVDPDTLEISLIGDFAWPGAHDYMTDIAIDQDGYMIGVSYTRVYAIDPETAQTVELSTLTGITMGLNALSFVPSGMLDPGAEEILIGADTNGRVFHIDPQSGSAEQIGSYGDDLRSSGDIVSVYGFGTVATVKRSTDSTDSLARLDPVTFEAEVIGDTGVANLWGLGYWGGSVYGFGSRREIVLIDPETAAGTPVATGEVPWWGAGVTTKAPIIN